MARQQRDPSFLYRGTQLAALQQAADRVVSKPGALPGPHQHQARLPARQRPRRRPQHPPAADRLPLSLVLLLIASSPVQARGRRGQERRPAARGSPSPASSQPKRSTRRHRSVTASMLAAAAWRIARPPRPATACSRLSHSPACGPCTGGNAQRERWLQPRRQTLATAGNDVRLWDVATHRQIGAPICRGFRAGVEPGWRSAPTARPWPPAAVTARPSCGTWPPTSRSAPPIPAGSRRPWTRWPSARTARSWPRQT